MLHHNWVCVRPSARLQKGPYDIIKVMIGPHKNNEKEDEGQTKKGSEVPFLCSQGLQSIAELILGQRWKLLLNLGCFDRSNYRSQIYESKYLSLANWQVWIVITISKVILLDQLYLYKMIPEGKRRKSQAFSFSVLIFCRSDLSKRLSSDWLYVEITKDLKKMSIWEFYGRPTCCCLNCPSADCWYLSF